MRRRQEGIRMRLRWIKHRRNRDGSFRVYVCQPGRKPVRLPNLPENHPDFIAAYMEAVREAPRAITLPRGGTLAAVMADYRASAKFRSLKTSTREMQVREFDRLATMGDGAGGKAKAAAITTQMIRRDVDRLTPGAASNRLKAWRALMAHAVVMEIIDRSPALDVKPPKQEGEGHHTWTFEEVEAFRAHWPHATQQRLAMELALWIGARRSDLCALGWQHVGRDGWLTHTQIKTGDTVSLPFTAGLVGEGLAEDWGHLEAALTQARNKLLFLETAQGRARSVKGAGNWFKTACRAAELDDQCTLHGLRKLRATRLAELGWSEGQIAAWTGHATLSEVTRYTRAASRRTMIRQASERGGLTVVSGTFPNRVPAKEEKP
ncbi:MAG: tyrosine-type recombinase/integrase [Pseudomonadota bacterium]